VTLFLILLYKNPPFVYNYKEEFPASIYIEKKTDLIINEYKKYISTNDAECLRKSVPGFTIENVDSNKTNCWRAIHLKKYGIIDEEMKYHFPETVSVLSDKQIHNAFFSILDPSVEIPLHVGYYKGYLRYHLGIIIPNNDTGKLEDKAYIVCGDEKYIWKAGKGIVFDDMYMHYVKNPTDQTRVVLYLDIKRKSDNFFVNKINDIGIFLIESSLLINLFLKNQHGQNKIEGFNTNIKN
jgi:beta-hydroxylase